jgi:hypothetical protein
VNNSLHGKKIVDKKKIIDGYSVLLCNYEKQITHGGPFQHSELLALTKLLLNASQTKEDP